MGTCCSWQLGLRIMEPANHWVLTEAGQDLYGLGMAGLLEAPSGMSTDQLWKVLVDCPRRDISCAPVQRSGTWMQGAVHSC